MNIGLENTGYFSYVAKKLSNIRHLPRWVVFSIDLAIVFFSISVTYLLMSLWGVQNMGEYGNRVPFVLACGVSAVSLILLNVSSGVVRHSSIRDIIKISLSTFLSLIVLFIISKVYAFYTGDVLILDFPLLLFILLQFLFLSLFRFYVKLGFILFLKFKEDNRSKNILVFDTDSNAVGIASAIQENTHSNFNLMGFVSPQGKSSRTRILDKKIYSLDKIINDNPFPILDGIVFSDSYIKADEYSDLLDTLIKNNIKIYHLPIQTVEETERGVNSGEIKSLQIEDLLYRKKISIENEEISKRHLGKTVLITGGAGSIGSELIRKVAGFNPKTIVVVDQAETPLNDIKLEMIEKFPEIDFIFHLADVSNKYRIEPLFKQFNFSMVYHAAAYKHVPIVEENPIEAINVNIIGTRIVADLAHKYKINRFVMVSTDKAVNPTNVMGASKRIAELYVQSLEEAENNTTKFITTRFGNVLGSNGSVIPLFRKQIEKGGPLTVTHEEITRFFMTIPEACELVLQAGTMGSGGEIFVFDMGEPVKIIDLAKKMIQLSGHEPYQDIDIEITGLRPGEKLYEELLSDKTTTLPTHHKKIMRAKDEPISYKVLDVKLRKLARNSLTKDKLELVAMMKEIVPEYISKNSTFETLDK